MSLIASISGRFLIHNQMFYKLQSKRVGKCLYALETLAQQTGSRFAQPPAQLGYGVKFRQLTPSCYYDNNKCYRGHFAI